MTKNILLLGMLTMGVFSSAQIQLGLSDSTSSSLDAIPWSNTRNFSYAQQIIKKSELNATAGNITGLKLYLSGNRGLYNSNEIVVYLGHTAKEFFNSDSDWLASSSMSQVFSGIVSNNNGIVEITFTTPFAYNNIENLVVAIDENSANYDFAGGSVHEYFYKYSVAPNSTLFYKGNTINPDPANIALTGQRSSYRSMMQVLGLTPNIAPECPIVTYPSAGETHVHINPFLEWQPAEGATSYTVSIGTTAGGTDIANRIDVGLVSRYYSYDVGDLLDFETTYYLTVSSINAAGTSTNCEEIEFTTLPFYPPNVSWPPLGGTNVSLNPTITWDSVLGATGYKISMGTSPGATDILDNEDVGNENSYNFPSILSTFLDSDTKYYYKINSYTPTLESEGVERYFTTINATLGTGDVILKSKEIKISPNPFIDDLNISDTSKLKSISVNDLSGKLVKTINNPSSAIHLGELKSGIYLIILEMKDGSKQVFKTIKKD